MATFEDHARHPHYTEKSRPVGESRQEASSDGPYDPPSTIGFSATSSNDDYYHDPDFVTSHNHLRSLLLSGANSHNSTRRPSFSSPERILAESATRPSQSLMYSVVSGKQRLFYLVNYIQEVASWVSWPSTALLLSQKLICVA